MVAFIARKFILPPTSLSKNKLENGVNKMNDQQINVTLFAKPQNWSN